MSREQLGAEAGGGDIGFARRLREVYRHSTLRRGEARRLIGPVQAAMAFQEHQVGLTGRPADVLAHIDGGTHVQLAAQAKKRLIEGVEQYVIREAKKLSNRGVELEDLIQEGLSGVMRAMETYDPGTGNEFLTYADDWIKQRMLRACERIGSIERYQMRIPCHQYMSNGRVAKVIERMREELGREPTPQELAVRAKLFKPGTSTPNEQHAEMALELLGRSFTSLDAQRAGDDSEVSVAEAIADPQAIDPVSETMREERARTVWDVFAKLSPDEQQVFSMRYGLGQDGRKYTQDEVCAKLGIKKSHLVALQKSARRQLVASEELQGIKDELLAAID